MSITLGNTANALDELKQVKDLKYFQQHGMEVFCEKYNITQPQCNFLLSIESVRRHKEVNGER